MTRSARPTMTADEARAFPSGYSPANAARVSASATPATRTVTHFRREFRKVDQPKKGKSHVARTQRRVP